MIFQKHLFTDVQKQQLVNAIVDAEEQTSGEIRVHTEPHCKGESLDRAVEMFKKLGMDQTDQRNGVLIYVAYKDKKFAIIGDKGIHEVVPKNFWESTKNYMAACFKNGNFMEGVEYGIREAGKHLEAYFPHLDGDKNELSNEISEG